MANNYGKPCVSCARGARESWLQYSSIAKLYLNVDEAYERTDYYNNKLRAMIMSGDSGWRVDDFGKFVLMRL